MDIAIFGLGYVGAVSAACLSQEGHRVVGVDSNEAKAGLINDGTSPVVERGLDTMIAKAVAEAKRRSGHPRKFRIFSTKNATHRVMDVVEVLTAEGLDQGLSLTMQSLSKTALATKARIL